MCNKEQVSALEGGFSALFGTASGRRHKVGDGGSVIPWSLDGGAGFAGGPAWQVITCNKEQVSALEGSFSACFRTASGRHPKVGGGWSVTSGTWFAGGRCVAGHCVEPWEVSGVGIEDAPSTATSGS